MKRILIIICIVITITGCLQNPTTNPDPSWEQPAVTAEEKGEASIQGIIVQSYSGIITGTIINTGKTKLSNVMVSCTLYQSTTPEVVFISQIVPLDTKQDLEVGESDKFKFKFRLTGPEFDYLKNYKIRVYFD